MGVDFCGYRVFILINLLEIEVKGRLEVISRSRKG